MWNSFIVKINGDDIDLNYCCEITDKELCGILTKKQVEMNMNKKITDRIKDLNRKDKSNSDVIDIVTIERSVLGQFKEFTLDDLFQETNEVESDDIQE